MTDFSKGDEVSWNTPQGKTDGKVTREVTSETTVGGYTARASKQDRQIEVRSNVSGKKAVHKPISLDKS